MYAIKDEKAFRNALNTQFATQCIRCGCMYSSMLKKPNDVCCDEYEDGEPCEGVIQRCKPQ